MENRKVPLNRHIKQNSCYASIPKRCKIIFIVYQNKFLSLNNNLKKALEKLTWYGYNSINIFEKKLALIKKSFIQSILCIIEINCITQYVLTFLIICRVLVVIDSKICNNVYS